MTENDTLRQRAEAAAGENAAQSPEDIEALSPEETRRTLHELRVHQLELTMQNEELRRTQVELAEARARYFDLYELAPVGYCTLSAAGLILEANLTAATLLGVGRATLVKQPLSRFIFEADQDLYYLHRHRLLKTGEAQGYDLRLVKPDGTIFWAQLAATAPPTPAASGAPVYRLVLSDITERKQAEAQLNQSLREKETLLRELYHRTKNNMNVIKAMLGLRAMDTKNEEARTLFNEMGNRIQTMAMVHQMLYEAQDLSRISLDHYIRELAQLALASYPLTANRVVMRFELTPVQVFIDTAIPCGLILTELISNALKYAFPGERTGEISLWLSRTAPDTIEFYLADNGVGVPEGFDFRNQLSLGLKLVITLVESQLGGAISFETDNGVTCRIRLTDTHCQARV